MRLSTRLSQIWLAHHDLLLVMTPVCILAIFTRVWQLNSLGFSGDQALYSGQAAALAGFGGFSSYFAPVSRGVTNFMIFQSFVAFVYSVFGVSDLAARVISAFFGIGTVILVFLIGITLFDRLSAVLSSTILAVSSYDVILSRMALIDSTAIFFFFLSLLFATRWMKFSGPRNFYLALTFAALSTLTKVTAVVIFAVLAILLVARPSQRTKRIRFVTAIAYLLPLVGLALYYAIGNWQAVTFGVGWQFWRASRNPVGDTNPAPPTPDFYLNQIIAYQGYLFTFLVAIAGAYAIRKKSLGDQLTLATTLVPLAVFELYPLKGFQYILPSVIGMSLMLGRFLGGLLQPRIPKKLPASSQFVRGATRRRARILRRISPTVTRRIVPTAAGAVFIVLILSLTVQSLTVSEYSGYYAGARELAYWLRDNTPANATFVTMLNGLANVITFYSIKPAYPALYLGQVNPRPNIDVDQLVANGTIRYVVIDNYSTSILKPYAHHPFDVRLKLAQYIETYKGVLVYVHFVPVPDQNLGQTVIPRAWVYLLNNTGR